MLLTKRLNLRAFSLSDKETIIGLLSDMDFMVYSPTGVMTRSQAERRFSSLLRAFEDSGIGKLAVIERSSGELIGYCGIESFKYENAAEVELGYRLKLSARGKGYAFEASKAVLALATQLGYQRVFAFTESDNTPSQHILIKLEFTLREQGVHQGMAIQYFEKTL
jgi:RimJ/RimL family protein N-acetyltransferase